MPRGGYDYYYLVIHQYGLLKNTFSKFYWYRGSPDSTNFAHPGNRTTEKIVLNGDLFSTKIPFCDFWLFKVPFFSYLILKKVKNVLTLSDFERHSKITKVINDSITFY